MSFLDNLENNLKALESLESGDIGDRRKREAERDRAVAVGPWAERLKASPYVAGLMTSLTRAGFARRMKVNFVWIDRVLRVEAAGERLELQPSASGVEAVFAGQRLPVELNAAPDDLIRQWLAIVDEKRQEQVLAAAEREKQIEFDENQPETV